MVSAQNLLTFVGGIAMFAASFGAKAAAADPPAPDEPQVTIVSRNKPHRHISVKSSSDLRVDVKLVPIPVTVFDSLDRPVEGLTSNDFHLFEDNVEQKIVSVNTEDSPVSLGVVFDTSASMNNKLQSSVAAVDQFLTSNVPGDEYLLVRFSDRPQLISGFTDDISDISGWLHSFHASGWTGLYDAIYMSIHKMKGAKNPRKALLVFSDGGDNSSRYTATETRRLVEEVDVRIYSVSLMESSHVLQQISDDTGGGMVRVRKIGELPEAMEKVSRELRSYYVLYYYSTNPQRDGRYRRVRLQVNRPQVHASWRRGYYME
jgi:Ca-activated chloride channel family protein